MYIFDIDDGELIRLRGVDSAKGAQKFTISAASTGHCTITLRLDSPNGTVIGTVNITKTKSAEKYRAFSTNVSDAAGVHDLYICFSDTSGNNRLDYWQFK